MLLELVRRRAERDPMVAAALVRGAGTAVRRVPPGRSVILNEVKDLATRKRDPSVTEFTLSEVEGLPQDDKRSVTSLVLLHIGAGARVQWHAPILNPQGYVFSERLIWLERGATLEYHGAAVGADALRENLHVVLAGEGATARVQTLFAGADDNQFDFGVTAEHRAPRTTSDLRAKGILGGKAQGVYRGLVRVEKNAVKSDGYQRCDALLLSPTAEADPIPTLEIETNDVRCTHGVTVSHVNTDQLFYLQSRGFSEAAARDLLVEGFAGTLLRSWPEGERERLRGAIQNVFTK